MRTLRQQPTTLILLIAAGLILAACTRTASTQVVPTSAIIGGEATVPQGLSGAEATMEAVRSSILTQTAVALSGAGGAVTATPPPLIIPTTTPVVVQPTVQPTAAQPLPTAPPVAPTPAPLPTPIPPVAAVPSTYTVQPGEWLYSIARKFGLDPRAVIAANPGINPNSVFPGQVINLPQPGAPAVLPPSTTLSRPTLYTVVLGDWLFSIARKFGVTTLALAAANPTLTFPYTIYPGQVLHIP